MLLGLMGTALVILQAYLWIPRANANSAVLILLAFVPAIAAVFIALTPRRMVFDPRKLAQPKTAELWINLGLPVLFTVLVLGLVWISDNFNNFAGFAFLLAANAGRNLRNFIRCLLQNDMDVHR